MRLLRLCLLLLCWCPVSSCQQEYAKPDTACSDGNFAQQLVTPAIQLIVPNAISPNGDMLNDHFVLYASYAGQPPAGAPPVPVFASRSLKIYTSARLQPVFESLNYNNEFDGHDSQGAELPEGKYYYQLALDGNSVRGSLVLVRTARSCGCRVVDPGDYHFPSFCR